MLTRFAVGSFVLALLSFVPACSPQATPVLNNGTTSSLRRQELDSGWVCMNAGQARSSGEQLSTASVSLSDWLPATVPGTVLTTLLNNKRIPDPLYGMNNRQIPDIYSAGKALYTYWFVKDFAWNKPSGDRQVWLRFRGVNYGFDLYVNGRRLNGKTEYGMFLRHTYNITPFLSADGRNRLAVLVYPPDPVGNPNGGQGGDGTIGRNVSNQYVAGWDWIQPVADRNTGIWDKVTVEETGSVLLDNPSIITIVPGERFPGQPQAPAIIRAGAEVANPTDHSIKGTLVFTIEGSSVGREVTIQPGASQEVSLPDLRLEHPRLWWPNGYGRQELYEARLRFVRGDNTVLDERRLNVGVRDLQTVWNSRTESREVLVNGQPIFIRGGNWITSDAWLRVSPERYDAEVRFHRDMNLNLIRIWGGGITERPEFYDACDRYGLLVLQDLWMSGDCNGKWFDPMKKEDQWTRRAYPDDHDLFLRSVADQVKMLRHHPSLAFFCGGNEITPPQDLLTTIQDSLLPAIDSARYFFTYSNVDSMSRNVIGGNGDGPYRLQPARDFWQRRSFPFNSEIGSVGMGDYESLERILPPENLTVVPQGWNVDSVWRYHKYSGYGNQLEGYGRPSSVREYAEKAQLVNYDQYRALMEGHLAHMWDWYTGLIIWKTQNPWTALRGQMYDWYLDPNAGLYGLHHANEPLHVMCSPVDSMLLVVNNTFRPCHDLMVQGRVVTCDGRDSLVFQWFVEVGASTVQKIESLRRALSNVMPPEGGFLDLRLLNSSRELLSENLYWFPDSTGNYSGLQRMPEAAVQVLAGKVGQGVLEVRIDNPAGGPLAFFQRISLVDRGTKKRLLPVAYSDNYVSTMPGTSVTVRLEYPARLDINNAVVSVRGWNVRERYVEIQATAGKP